MDIEDPHIGRRVREIRTWRRMSVTATAGLAGMSTAYLSLIERGLRPVTKRATLEALAQALRVSPVELSGKPYTPVDPVSSETHAAISAIESALTDCELGCRPDCVEPRPWPELAADLNRLNEELGPNADYAGQSKILPTLIEQLHAIYIAEPARHREILVALLHVYNRAETLTKNLGVRGLPSLAVLRAQRVAEELGDPAWLGMVAWLRGCITGVNNRARQYALSVRAADELTKHLNNPNALQMYGMLHLNAAMSVAAQGRREECEQHLNEANTIANRMEDEVGTFAYLWFGRANVGIWRVTLATELGEGARVGEIARTVHPEVIPAASRQAMYFADLGRALVTERHTRDQGIRALAQAEKIAPQRVRNDVFVREAVASLLTQARRDAGGRELRGLAYRMGVAPMG